MKTNIYINVAVMGSVNYVLANLLRKIEDSGLSEHADKIILAVGGDANALEINTSAKTEIIHASNKPDHYEFPALSKLWHDCQTEDIRTLYLHTKGVSRMNPNINDWVELLSYFNIERWRERVSDLDQSDCAGVNLKGNPDDIQSHPSWWGYGKAPLHYSGNFWWSKSSHIKRLVEPYSWTPDNELGRWRMMAEMWVCSLPGGKYSNAYSSDVDHYQSPFPRSIYESKL